MKRNSERGVALVITLIMLSLVTLMAVVFLAISRRERASVTVSGDMAMARLMTDTAVARAQSELVARMMASTNLFNYDLIVSTNYYNPLGFQPNLAGINPYNVNYGIRRDGRTMMSGSTVDWIQNIANLQYDPRPPVFYPPNVTGGTNDFRFYLDLNRNGLYEPTGVFRDPQAPFWGTNYYVGDPEWIGVLEHPDLPHSDTNQFIGRYAFVIMPTGKSLDLNFIHNAVKRLRANLSLDGYYRNQGVGSWELNLGGFFRALNTNLWDYSYNPNLAQPSSGRAFEDALSILSNRYSGSLNTLLPAQALFNFAPNPNNPFALSAIDYYSDGPATTYAYDSINQPWAGSYNTNGYYDVQSVFDPIKTSTFLPLRFINARTTNLTSTLYDRYTFYRMLGQMGVDSQVPSSNLVYFGDRQLHYTNRLHLNYANFVPNGQTNFIPWSLSTAAFNGHSSFFTNAADRMLRSSLDLLVFTNTLNRLQTNFMIGITPVRDVFSCTNIQLIHNLAGEVNPNLGFYMTNNEYSATVHRLLQVAANIHDASTVQRLGPVGTTNDYPSVFRPVFLRTLTNLIIRGFVEETNSLFASYPCLTVEQAAGLQAPPPGLTAFPVNVLVTNRNLYGVGPIIGVKKGYPNFNKFVLQTVTDVSRRLEIRKASPFSMPIETNQMYQVGVSNRFAIEGWNSYLSDFTRNNLELRVTNQMVFAFHHQAENATIQFPVRMQTYTLSTNALFTRWPAMTSPASFMEFNNTNLATLPTAAYETVNGTFVPVATNAFERSFRVPNWVLILTNRLQYIVIDHSARPVPRVIDYVSLDKLVTEVDLTRGLTGNTNAGGGGIFSDKGKGTQPGQAAALTDGDMWNPQHTSINVPSLGILNQIAVARGNPFVGEGTWKDSNGQIVSDKQWAITQFKEFLAGQLTNLAMQVPFTPSRRLYQKSSWEANDPLVHYTVEDLTDPASIQTTTNLLVQPIAYTYDTAPDAMLGQLNKRYRPWGGRPGTDPSNDQTAYNVTLKDPLIRSSDNWQFPTNLLPNLGWLGRVHRGSPWQTIYLKAPFNPATRQFLDVQTWQSWSGSYGTHPTNDWRLLDCFTTAPNDNASRGLLSVNQTNLAAWSAVLSGVTVLSNSLPDIAAGPKTLPRFAQLTVNPDAPQLLNIVAGINRTHAFWTNHTFRTLGEVLATPELTVLSPYLSLTPKQIQNGIDDATYERIPQEVLSLLRTDEPRVTIYAFGQALRPADRSLVTLTSGVNPPIFNLCTNYQVTGEFATKTVLRLENLAPESTSRQVGAPVAQKMRAVVESFSILQPD
jgi:hypothetical protein